MSNQNTEQVKWWCLALGAVFQKRDGWSHETLGPRDIAREDKDHYRTALADSWQIENRDQLHSQLDWLYNQGQQASYMETRNEIACMKRSRVEALASEIAEGDKEQLRLFVVLRYQHALGVGGVLGFDASRAFWVCKLSYLLGIMTEQEAYAYLHKFAQRVQPKFNDWYQYSLSYMIGREFWQPSTSTDNLNMLMKDAKGLAIDPSSPWQKIPWNLDLSATL